MIAIMNYNKLLPARDAKPEEKRHLPKREAMYNAAINMAMQYNVKSFKEDMIYPRNMTSNFSTALHNIKEINYSPLVFDSFNS